MVYLSSYFRSYTGFTAKIWLMMLTVFANAVGAVTTIFLSLYLESRLQFTVPQIGWVMTGFGVGALVFSYLGGYLSDYISPLKIAMVALLVNGITLFFLVHSKAYLFIFTMTTIMGGANAAYVPASRTYLMSLVGEKLRQRVSSLRYMILNVGSGAGVFIDSWLVKKDYSFLFVANGIAILFAAFILFFLCYFSTTNENVMVEKKTDIIKVKFYADKSLLLLFFSLFCAALIFAQLKTSYPIYLNHYYHMNAQRFSYLFILNTSLIVFLQLPLLEYLRKYNLYFSVAMGMLMLALGFWILPFFTSYTVAMTSCVCWTLGEILIFSTLQVLIYERALPQQKGQYMGMYQWVYAFAMMIGPLTGSALYPYFHGELLWMICGFLGVIGFLFCVLCYQIISKQNEVIVHVN